MTRIDRDGPLELETALDAFVVCVKLASLRQALDDGKLRKYIADFPSPELIGLDALPVKTLFRGLLEPSQPPAFG